MSAIDVQPAYFEDFLTDPALGELLDRVDARATTKEESERTTTGRDPALELDLVGSPYPPYPEHDLRAAQRQAVALGAAVGAAGLAGPLRPVDMMLTSGAVDEQFDRPWAIEALSPLPDIEPTGPSTGFRRFTRYLRPRRRR